MQQYLDLLKFVNTKGVFKNDRTGVGTKSIFGYQMRFDLSKNFPILTTKKIYIKSIIYELLWFISGNTNIKYLKDNHVNIWNKWADKIGNLGPIYGYQWRHWSVDNNKKIDQITELINNLKNNPNSRRHIVTAWNPSDINQMALPPCHCLFQFYIVNKKLSCQLYQRSADIFLGLPFNIVSYSLFTMMIAQVCNLKVGDFILNIGDAHLYINHINQIKLQLTRIPKILPKMKINTCIKNIFDFKFEDFILIGYESHSVIKAPIAV